MCMGIVMQDSHPSRGIPMEMETKLLKLMGMGIAHTEMGTLIIYVFPFSHNFPSKICF